MRFRHNTFATIFDTVYVGLAANLLFIAGFLPLLAGLALTDPARSWPLLAAIAPLCAPGLCGVFAVLSEFSGGRSTAVLSTFGRVWRASWRRATALAALSSAAVVVLAVDIRFAWGRTAGALAIPVLATLIALTVATTLLGLVALSEAPAARLRDVARAGAYLAVRRWYLTAVSLAVLALLAQLIVTRPAIALGLAAAPLLYVVWANSRFTLRTALPDSRPLAHHA
ncbi:hypothetical protein Rhe02_35800 [Rhizocola hellebori]|uniref:Ferredoxin-NADPH reductase n=1 Tax=Rhizocola hellebori TaxID=1392758 RepID=A0A8J3Q965_9ACTN|nr:hypothetical protein [Rhizocola hellebori]GIH05513.1 hypothetical protein Rhe02_35800 [Rhizocola hellebori]